MSPEPEAPPRRRPRWGVRSLLWLTLAFASVVGSNVLHGLGNDDWVLVTFGGTVLGLGAATYCSIRGLATAGWLGR